MLEVGLEAIYIVWEGSLRRGSEKWTSLAVKPQKGQELVEGKYRISKVKLAKFRSFFRCRLVRLDSSALSWYGLVISCGCLVVR